VAGKGIVRGIERRQPRVIRPHRWTVLSVLRGIINPLMDRQMERDAELQAITRELDSRGDQRGQLTAEPDQELSRIR
jgi:hypothetical protein